MPIHTITQEEVARLTDQAARLFIARHVNDYWPCEINSRKMTNFISSQLGEDYPFVWTLEHFEAAFAYLNEHDFLLQRPIEEPEVDPAVAREQAAQQKVRDDYDARQTAAKLERDRNLPLNELAKVVSVQNAQLRKIRETSGLPVRSTGMESRHVEQVKLGIPAQARVNVGLAQPELSPKSAEFTKLYAAELTRLRGQQ
jgi:hypothetical protein